MLQEINHLRQIAEHCRTGAALDPTLANWLGSCLDEFLSRRVGHMDEAFGLRTGRGGVPWRMEQALRTRDAALRALSERLEPSLSVRARTRAICQLASRYAASAWCIDKLRREMPAAYAGTAREHLWVAFRSGAPMPIGERRLCEIIAA